MAAASDVLSGVNCPKCGELVLVPFARQVTANARDRAHAPYKITLTQAAPMVCPCGFTYPPPAHTGQTGATLPVGATEAPTAHEHPSEPVEGLDGLTVGELTETETGEP